ncbi:fructosamine kinase family protein [Fluviibacterium sp. DFM31]|uniref:Fructosamine kinase family protein n=1 Tax=Meridianimarinicoccus marinus TaxID=3231483 RepID=A0ABV3L3G8_9RHOB
MTQMTARDIAHAAGIALNTPVTEAERLSGGDLCVVLRLHLGTGGSVVAKSGPAPRVEAKMLTAIRATGVPAPKVLAVSDRVLVLEDLPDDGVLNGSGWRALGAALRRLHGTTGTTYGWPEDYAFGALRIPNAPVADWPGFWAERRLLPKAAALPPPFARRLEALARELPNRLPRTPAPALLHGDLWSGNLLAQRGTFTGLVDPASYHGHGEVDLAMLHLFGTPGPEFAEAYGATEPGCATRRPIYQLWPAIVHVRLFGAGYHGMLDGLLTRCGV